MKMKKKLTDLQVSTFGDAHAKSALLQLMNQFSFRQNVFFHPTTQMKQCTNWQHNLPIDSFVAVIRLSSLIEVLTYKQKEGNDLSGGLLTWLRNEPVSADCAEETDEPHLVLLGRYWRFVLFLQNTFLVLQKNKLNWKNNGNKSRLLINDSIGAVINTSQYVWKWVVHLRGMYTFILYLVKWNKINGTLTKISVGLIKTMVD